ncbi:aspartyl-phosphate phosphatase Spo0E family protein [Anaerosolibacter sp.]|uniref:aspartyl-phosphate phosphatase Spo0E family protein n=1 Tax=Anaerosolibacter sp. TaxID=1872527 RepID=UPI00262679C3|nr:aspartyl-phosphate phosphatase Spo0E family protein [Anaerosolibacter sp.]MDF2548010.1 Spo0E like sporulation regulatory protein [Anaerosolibacter sp.]
MTKLEELAVSIERLRKVMHRRIQRQGDLLSPQVIDISQKLDKLLNEYNKETTKEKLSNISKTLSVLL